jgi:hypothetical protein
MHVASGLHGRVSSGRRCPGRRRSAAWMGSRRGPSSVVGGSVAAAPKTMVHCTSARASECLNPQWRFGQGLSVFQVDVAALGHQAQCLRQCGLQQPGVERRVQQHQVEAAGRAARHPGQSVGRSQRAARRPPAAAARLQAARQLAGRAPAAAPAPRRATRPRNPARRCRQRHRAAPAGQVLAQPVEQGLAHAVGRGAQAGLVGHRQLAALPLSAYEADFVFHSRTGMPSRAISALAWPTVNSP